MQALPVDAIRHVLHQALVVNSRVVLTAPTGSGKSTRVPGFVLEDTHVNGRILVLQPRRLAARMLARRVARERNCRLGDEVGFQTRFERAVSRNTQILFMTAGILPRLFLSNATLNGIGAVLFDEFHERALNTDLGLALTMQLQQQRPDLKLIVMSATLDAEDLAQHLSPCEKIETQGRLWPVEISYLPAPDTAPVWEQTAKAVKRIIAREAQGDILAFLPGRYEIIRTLDACRQAIRGEGVTVLPLYGELPPGQQDAVLDSTGKRKIVLATNIAETSLTIPGIRHVIDSGLVRIASCDPARGLNILNTEFCSRAAADQRAGRAGREAPGTCFRLYTRPQFERRPERQTPEIHRVDLAETILFLHAVHTTMEQLPWIDPPKPERVQNGNALLSAIGALTPENKITSLGRELARFPLHPRLSRLLLNAAARGCLPAATRAAALLAERPILAGGEKAAKVFRKAFSATASKKQKKAGYTPVESDFFALFRALDFARKQDYAPTPCRQKGILAAACRQVERTARFFLDLSEANDLDTHTRGTPEQLILALLPAFPDHLARQPTQGTSLCLLPDGRHAELSAASTVRHATLLLATERREVTQGPKAGRILLSLNSEIREEWLDQLFPDAWEFSTDIVWNERTRAVEECTLTRCLGLVINEQRSPDVPAEKAAECLASAIRRLNLPLRGWGKDVKNWIARVRCVAAWFPERELIQYDDDEQFLALQELCTGARKYKEVKDKPALPFLRHLLSWKDQQFVEAMAPAELRLASGRRLRLVYRPGAAPRASARIQELYDTPANPVIAGGRQTVLLEILAPNMRAVQVTDDLRGFWRDLYPEVKKELARRYPKHEWR